MSKNSISVVGVMIGATYKDYKLYHMDERWETSNENGTYRSNETAGSGTAEGLKDILGYLSIAPQDDNQFIVVYDVNCPNKEEQLKKLLTAINNKIKKNDLLPTLISIGHEESQFSADITAQVSNIREVEATENPNNLLQNIVSTELSSIKKKLLAEEKQADIDKKAKAQPPQPEATHSSSTTNISMMVFGGFIAAIGITAVAVAFTLLNAATLGLAGLVVAGIGVTAALTGLGLFATAACRGCKTTVLDDSLERLSNLAPH